VDSNPGLSHQRHVSPSPPHIFIPMSRAAGPLEEKGVCDNPAPLHSD